MPTPEQLWTCYAPLESRRGRSESGGSREISNRESGRRTVDCRCHAWAPSASAADEGDGRASVVCELLRVAVRHGQRRVSIGTQRMTSWWFVSIDDDGQPVDSSRPATRFALFRSIRSL